MNLIGKFIKKCLYKPYEIRAVITIDGSYISCGLFRVDHGTQKIKVYAKSRSKCYGYHIDNIYNKYELTLAIARVLDAVEHKSKVRIKRVTLNILSFNIKTQITTKDPYNVQTNSTFADEINSTNKNFTLGGYITTNSIPLPNNEYLFVGYSYCFIKELSDIFYNLSIEIDGFIYPPSVFNFFKKVTDSPMLFVAEEYTIFFNKQLGLDSEIIMFGTNSIIDNISKQTNIPYPIVEQHANIINQTWINSDPEEGTLFKVKHYSINKLHNVVNNAVKSYFKDLEALINSKNLSSDDIFIVSNYLKLLFDNGKINMNVKGMQFSRAYEEANLFEGDFCCADLLNNLSSHYLLHFSAKDRMLFNFSKNFHANLL